MTWSSQPRSFVKWCLYALTSAVAIAILVGSSAHAISSTGPDPNISTAKPRYVLVKSPNTGDMSTAEVPIYFKKSTFDSLDAGDIKLTVTDFSCYDNNACGKSDLTDQYVELSYASGGLISRTNGAKTIALNKSKFTFDTATGLYRTVISMQLRNGNNTKTPENTFRNRILFRLKIAPTSGLIGAAARGSASYVNLVANNPNDGKNYDYSIPFASECSMRTATTKTITLYDLDSGDADNGSKAVTVKVVKIGGGSASYKTSGSLENGKSYNISLTFEPSAKYELRITGVNSINMVQYRFPYDDINSKIGCDWATTSKSTVNGKTGTINAIVDDTIDWTHTLTNNGPNVTTSTITSSISMSGFSNGWVSGSTPATKAVGVKSGSLIRNITASTANKTKYKITAADNGKTLCQWLVYKPQSSSVTTQGASSPKACVKVNHVWSVTPVVRVTSAAALNKPGDTVTWGHTITSDGPNKTLGTITYTGKNSGYLGTGTVDTRQQTASLNKGASAATFSSSYRITDNDVGQSLCRITTASPGASSPTTAKSSDPACIVVPYNYTLDPKVTIAASVIDTGSAGVPIDSSISNAGPTKSEATTQWQLSYMLVSPTGTIPAAGYSAETATPCAYYQAVSGVSSCGLAKLTGSGAAAATTGTGSIPVGGISFVRKTGTFGDLEVGTRVCYALSVKNPTASGAHSTEWRHSAAACAIVAKRPMTQVHGGDLIVGRTGTSGVSISTNTKVTADGKRYGSWAEYGIASGGFVKGMASAAGYSGGSSQSLLCQASFLTFGNRTKNGVACSDSTIGQYKVSGVRPAVAAQFPTAASTPSLAATETFSVSGSPRASGVYTAGSSLSISAVTVGKGRWYVVNAPNTTVKINGNISYANGPFASLGDLPQMIIIARNIIIADSVTRVDAWLVASGTGADGRVNTCGTNTGGTITETSAINSDICKSVLRINGPVMANHLVLRRTAGAGTGAASGDPAEVFNLRPDAYMWAAYMQNTAQTKVQTVQTKELPPRF